MKIKKLSHLFIFLAALNVPQKVLGDTVACCRENPFGYITQYWCHNSCNSKWCWDTLESCSSESKAPLINKNQIVSKEEYYKRFPQDKLK